MWHGQTITLINGETGIYLGMEGNQAIVKIFLTDSRGDAYGVEIVNIDPSCIRG